MEYSSVIRLIPRVMFYAASLGWMGLLGLVLLFVSLLTASIVVPARMVDLDHANAQVDALQLRVKQSGPDGDRNRPQGQEEKLDNFYGFFPPASTLPDWLEQIFTAADRSGVRIESGEYKLVQERGWKLDRYQITYPVKGGYTQIRAFIADFLTAVPAASLDEVSFRREAISSPVLDARLRMTIHVGSK